ncbi:MAG: hypothetical protein ACRDZ6_06690 [Acidimicrobiales bacterium]
MKERPPQAGLLVVEPEDVVPLDELDSMFGQWEVDVEPDVPDVPIDAVRLATLGDADVAAGLSAEATPKPPAARPADRAPIAPTRRRTCRGSCMFILLLVRAKPIDLTRGTLVGPDGSPLSETSRRA